MRHDPRNFSLRRRRGTFAPAGGAAGGAKTAPERAGGNQHPAGAGFFGERGRASPSADGAGSGGEPGRATARGNAGCAVPGANLRGVSGIVPIAGRTSGGRTGRCGGISRGVFSVLRAILFPLHDFCGRSFGYVLSGATLLGFFWALWDEDRFTWQDRISQTYITAATPLMEPEAFEIPAGHWHRLAHK